MTVKVYSTSTCGYCRMLKAYFDEIHVAYTDIPVDKDQSAAEEMLAKSGQMGVPFTVITDDSGAEEHILGFNKPAIDQALGL